MSNKQAYVAYFDALGFSNVVNNHNTSDLDLIVKTMFDGFNNAIDKSRTLGGGKINISNIKFHLFSDSFIIWTEDIIHSDGNITLGSYYSVFRNLLEAIIEIIKYGLLNGFPLRGALSYGDIVIHGRTEVEVPDKKLFLLDDSIYGRAYMEAYKLEGIQEWSGCIVSQSAWNQIFKTWSKIKTQGDDPHCLFNKYPYFVWYPVPTKDGNHETIAVNWNSGYAWDINDLIDSETIKKSFKAYKKELPENFPKLNETLKFWEYTNKLANDISQRTGKDFKEEMIPLPPSKDSITNNDLLFAQYSPKNT